MKLISTSCTATAGLLALVIIGAVACDSSSPGQLPAKIVNIPGKLTPAMGLSAAEYQIWGSAADAPTTVDSDGSFAADSSGWHTGVVFAMPVKGSLSEAMAGSENGLYMSPAAGGSHLVTDGNGYGFTSDSGGVMAMDATTTIIAMLLMHPVLAHPSPDVSAEQLRWMVGKLSSGWPCVADAAEAYDAALVSGNDFSVDPAFSSAFLTCLEDVGDIPEFTPPVPTEDQLATMEQGLETKPADYVSHQSDIEVSSLPLKSQDENGITVKPSTRRGTALDYLSIVTMLKPASMPDGMESPLFTNIDPYSPHASASTLASTFVPSDAYWSYLDIAGNTIRKVSGLIPGLVSINPSSTVTMSAGNFFEARFFSGGEDNKTGAFLFEAAAARSHNITMAVVEALSVIPGVNEMLGNEAGQKTLEAAVKEAIARAEGLTGRDLTVKNVYEATYGVLKKAVDTYVLEMAKQSAATGVLAKAADWVFSGGKKVLKFVVSVPTKIAKGGAATNRTYRIVYPESTMEYYIVAVVGNEPDAGTGPCGPKCNELAACCPKITGSLKADCEKWASQCVESSCQIFLDGSGGRVYCRD